MGKPSHVAALDPVADLQRRLARHRTSVPACVRTWWRDHELGHHPATVGKRIALALIEQRSGDAKLAGIVVLEQQLADQLRTADLAAFARLFEAGDIAELALADAFGRRVLARVLDRGTDAAHGLVRWGAADTCAQRRAACLGFATHAGLVGPALATCATVVWSHERADQQAVALVLRAFAAAEPARVEAFFRRHARLMTREAARTAVAPLTNRGELLAHHKRATTLRR